MVWVNAVSGRLETRINYSSGISYNTFPFPKLKANQIQLIESQVLKILSIREEHSDKTIADLYDPSDMPEILKNAHENNDLLIDSCYRNKPFKSDEERLEHLFNLYNNITQG